MTTIAIRDGIIAFDSRIKDGNTISPSSIKKVRYSEKLKAILAFCGTISVAAASMRKLEKLGLPWRKAWKEGATLGLDSDTEILVIEDNGSVYEFVGDDNWILTEGEFFAYGSGSVAAIAAMHAGANAKRSVEIACMVDSNSAPPVLTLDIADCI
jgi:ATP-dependent protease HslVU (ClpYQ) peptidase subunit